MNKVGLGSEKESYQPEFGPTGVEKKRIAKAKAYSAKKAAASSRRTPRREVQHTSSFPVVGIGASAGGLEAFTLLLKHLPIDTGMAFVLIQHLDPGHVSSLTEILSRATAMPVDEVKDGSPVQPNHVYVIPPNTNLTFSKGVLKLSPRGDTRMPHRPVDCFLNSLAEEREEQAVGVILSGTATDGTLGLQVIKERGGIAFAQDEKSAKYDGMPRSAIASGVVDFVLPPEQIAKELGRISRHPYMALAEAARPSAAQPAAPPSRSGWEPVQTDSNFIAERQGC